MHVEPLLALVLLYIINMPDFASRFLTEVRFKLLNLTSYKKLLKFGDNIVINPNFTLAWNIHGNNR